MKIISLRALIISAIILVGCSTVNTTISNTNNAIGTGSINKVANGTHTRTPFPDERTGGEWDLGTTVTTIQDLENGDFAHIHWLVLQSGTQLLYSGYNYTTPWESSAYKEIFKNQSGYTFIYSEINGNPQIAIKIYNKNILKNIPENIFSGLCAFYDQSEELGIPKGIKFGYRPSAAYQEQIDTYRKDQNTILDSNISKIMEINGLDMMYPCGGFLNNFQIIGTYIVAGGFGWKDGGGRRGGRLNNTEIIQKINYT